MEHLELVTSLQLASEKISLSEMKYEVKNIFFKAKGPFVDYDWLRF